MRRLFLFFAAAAALVVGATFHHAHAGGVTRSVPTLVDICHLDGTSSPGLFDVTMTTTAPGYTSETRTVIKYYAGVKMSVPSSAVDGHLGHGDSLVFSPLYPEIEQYLTTMESIQDTAIVFGDITVKWDYSNVNLVAGNADCFWYFSQTTTTP